jgi:hypothetical protein
MNCRHAASSPSISAKRLLIVQEIADYLGLEIVRVGIPLRFDVCAPERSPSCQSQC